MERAPQRRVRRDRAEQHRLGSQVLDVGTRLPTAGQHQHGLREDLAPVVQRQALTADRDPGRQAITEAQPVGKGAKSVQAYMGCDLVPAGLHHHRNRRVTVHLAGALLARDQDASATSESLARWALARMVQISPSGPLNDRG